ncbi:MAG: ATP synthase F1 subunit delta [Phycisphaerales bacterium]|nr:ATP synthase F1 subunit delta [Phycisphaerae bacterium]NNF41704.1 ATP synthase F1 subunit delta [Phycisphaerales bacterium]NNM25574.1 ATP synthase F1 subunit delta [Phycisphaerales bacterium]
MATHTDALAQVYARSLYELAEKAGGLEKIIEIASELEEICEIARSDRGFREFIASPVIDRAKRAESLNRCFRDQITDLTLRFLLVLNRKGRLSHLEMINTAYDQLVQAAHDRVEVDVFTATTLNPEQLEAIRLRVREAIGQDAVLHPYTDPTMLGGVKLRIGDQLVDGSVATRLRRLRHGLQTNGPAALRAKFDRIVSEEDVA